MSWLTTFDHYPSRDDLVVVDDDNQSKAQNKANYLIYPSLKIRCVLQAVACCMHITVGF